MTKQKFSFSYFKNIRLENTHNQKNYAEKVKWLKASISPKESKSQHYRFR